MDDDVRRLAPFTCVAAARREAGASELVTLRPDGRWGGSVTSRPLPEDETIARLSPMQRRTLTEVWLGRAASERRVSDSFVVVRGALASLDAPAELVELAMRAVDDEMRHAELSRLVASRYAGEPLAHPPRLVLSIPRHAGASERIRHVLHVVGQCAFNETIASAFLEAALVDTLRGREDAAEAAEHARHDVDLRFVSGRIEEDAAHPGAVRMRRPDDVVARGARDTPSSAARLASTSAAMRPPRPSGIHAPPSRRIPHFVTTRTRRPSPGARPAPMASSAAACVAFFPGPCSPTTRPTRRSLCPASAWSSP